MGPDLGRNLDRLGVLSRCRMGYGQQNDETGYDGGVGSRDEARRPLLAMELSGCRFPVPKIVVAQNQAGPWIWKRHLKNLFQKLVQRGMLGGHLSPAYRIDHHTRRLIGRCATA